MESVSLGQHLTPPEGCPDVIKTLMMSCWQQVPNNRLSFSEIINTLSADSLKCWRHKVTHVINAPRWVTDEKYMASILKRNEKLKTDLFNISKNKRKETPPLCQKSNNVIFIDSKCRRYSVFTELPKIQTSLCIETEKNILVL